MKFKCAFSGSGGQGAALMAKLACLAAIKDSKQVVMTQTYGIEQRGGDSTGYVIISDQPIGNPIVESDADVAVAMSDSTYQATVDSVKDGGKLFVNSSMVEKQTHRPAIEQILLPVSAMAQELGDVRCANIIMLGAVAGLTGMLTTPSLIGAIEDHMGKKKAALLDLNISALKKGLQVVGKE
ncbi:MAG: 2-oxoacid:acceptor oxidoreductase family protein [Deltaproteobacteria bacterium]|nr:2-oxoacid:acceptor oxidoreductase family protein [Deltaproteobacteria bacterium]